MDYLKDRYKQMSIYTLCGRHVIVEKKETIIDKLRNGKSKETGDNLHKLIEFSNMKLWWLMALVQGFKMNAVKNQAFEEAAFLRTVERFCGDILIARRDKSSL